MIKIARKFSRKWGEDEKIRLLQCAIQAVKMFCNPTQIYAFGSILTNNFDDSSDVDLVLIFKTVEEAKNVWRLHSKFRQNFSKPLDIISFDEANFELKKEMGGIAMVAHTEGKLVYLASGFGKN
jgi:predicted nucleotidyltransferase